MWLNGGNIFNAKWLCRGDTTEEIVVYDVRREVGNDWENSNTLISGYRILLFPFISLTIQNTQVSY